MSKRKTKPLGFVISRNFHLIRSVEGAGQVRVNLIANWILVDNDDGSEVLRRALTEVH